MDNLANQLPKKPTLEELLTMMDRRNDSDDWEDFKDDEPFDLATLTREKIAGYHDIIEALEDDSKRLKARADQFKNLADIQARKAQRIENRLRFTMRMHNAERLPGNDFNAVRGKRKNLDVKQPNIGIEHFLRFGPYVQVDLEWKDKPSWKDANDVPERVVKCFTWDKNALRIAFKAGTAPKEITDFVDYQDAETFKWEPRKL